MSAPLDPDRPMNEKERRERGRDRPDDERADRSTGDQGEPGQSPTDAEQG